MQMGVVNVVNIRATVPKGKTHTVAREDVVTLRIRMTSLSSMHNKEFILELGLSNIYLVRQGTSRLAAAHLLS